MGFVLRALLTGVSLYLGLTAGDVMASEIKYQYKRVQDRREQKTTVVEETTVID
mgnify:CR=1 FL=1